MTVLKDKCSHCGAACVWSRTNDKPTCITCRLRSVEEDLAAFKVAHEPLRGGAPAEVLSEAEQDAKSWEASTQPARSSGLRAN